MDLPLIVGGDFNDTPESEAVALMESNGFLSAQDALLGEADTYVGSDFQARIDYLFLLGGIDFSDFSLGDSPNSDHLSLSLTVSANAGSGGGE